jgi:uncharacterized protein
MGISHCFGRGYSILRGIITFAKERPMPLTLHLLDGRFAVCRLAPDTATPPWAVGGPLVSVTRTREELSIVCGEDAVPEGIRCERGWRCFQLQGPIPFNQIGVLASLTAPLAAADISLFALSTFDTDYLLVKTEVVERAVEVLKGAGHAVRDTAASARP